MSRAAVVSSREIEVRPDPADERKGIQLDGKAGVPYTPTNWSFGQLASLAGAPAGYLRKLPAPLVADNLNYGLKFDRDVEDVGLLLTKEGDHALASGSDWTAVWPHLERGNRRGAHRQAWRWPHRQVSRPG